jgi:phosphoglycerol transferase MdoB-like AlkP superfamily enzyme
MTRTFSKLTHWRAHHKRLADLIIYIGISLCVAASVVVAALEGVSENLVLESFFFFLITLLIFIHFIKKNRGLWRRKGFWSLTSILFLLHCGAWFFAFKRVGRPPEGLTFIAVWFIAGLLEIKLFQTACNSILKPEHDHYLPE